MSDDNKDLGELGYEPKNGDNSAILGKSDVAEAEKQYYDNRLKWVSEVVCGKEDKRGQSGHCR